LKQIKITAMTVFVTDIPVRLMRRHGSGDRLPAHPALPGLEPPVDRFFRQLG